MKVLYVTQCKEYVTKKDILQSSSNPMHDCVKINARKQPLRTRYKQRERCIKFERKEI